MVGEAAETRSHKSFLVWCAHVLCIVLDQVFSAAAGKLVRLLKEGDAALNSTQLSSLLVGLASAQFYRHDTLSTVHVCHVTLGFGSLGHILFPP